MLGLDLASGTVFTRTFYWLKLLSSLRESAANRLICDYDEEMVAFWLIRNEHSVVSNSLSCDKLFIYLMTLPWSDHGQELSTWLKRIPDLHVINFIEAGHGQIIESKQHLGEAKLHYTTYFVLNLCR